MEIRLARPPDMAAVNDLRNWYVRTSTAVYTDDETTLEQRLEWLRQRDMAIHPVTVAVDAGEVVGWGSLSAYNEKRGYQATAEDSVYVRPDRHRQGIGRALLGDLLERGRAGGIHLVIARVDSEQVPSVRLHEALGFTEAGRLREAGWKFDRWLTVIYLQKLL